ncbi:MULTISPECIES: tail fiber domain-containing protein, partial [Acinetobacter calcoaceticus/baumannii complex]
MKILSNQTPVSDNSLSLGIPTNSWSAIYSWTDTIQTSDENLKQDIEEITEAERRVALACKALIRKYKFKPSCDIKGEEARWHIGVIAQQVKAAFDAENLNGFDYGILCRDDYDAVTEPIFAERKVKKPYRVTQMTSTYQNENGDEQTIVDEQRVPDDIPFDHDFGDIKVIT